MRTPIGDEPAHRRIPDARPDHRAGVAKATLVTGGSFATAIAGILGAAGLWGLGDRTILHALVTLCVIVAVTMFTTASVLRR